MAVQVWSPKGRRVRGTITAVDEAGVVVETIVNSDAGDQTVRFLVEPGEAATIAPDD